ASLRREYGRRHAPTLRALLSGGQSRRAVPPRRSVELAEELRQALESLIHLFISVEKMGRDANNSRPPVHENAPLGQLLLEALRFGGSEHDRASAPLRLAGTLQAPSAFPGPFHDPLSSAARFMRDRGKTRREKNLHAGETGIEGRNTGSSLRETAGGPIIPNPTGSEIERSIVRDPARQSRLELREKVRPHVEISA